MGQIIGYGKSYKEYKAELDGEFKQATESFVKIGYLLRVAKDTDILAESGYKDYNEFAMAEYGLESSQVNRFMNINKRFSEGGYSDHLLPEYQGFGSSKLALMLQLPDTINEELTPAYSKSDIQTIKDEIDEEKKVSDIEVYLEDRPKMPESKGVDKKTELLYQTLYNLFKAEPELYVEIYNIRDTYKWLGSEAGGISGIHEKIRSVIAPSGEKMYSARIPGRSRAMLMINEESYKITLLRTSEKLEYSDKEMEDGFTYCGMWGKGSPEEKWEGFYGENFPVAPEQQKNDKPKWGENAKNPVNTRKDRKVVKAAVKQSVRKPEKEEEKVEENKGLAAVPPAESGTAKGSEENTEAGSEEGTGKAEADNTGYEEPDKQDDEAGGTETGGNDLEGEGDRDGYSVDNGLAGEELVQGLEPNVLRGFKAAVTNNLNTLRRLWEGDNSNKIKLMLDVVEDLEWRLKQIQRGV
jgi:hypothetical protein